MNETAKYRIKENHGVFEIQVLGYEEKGMLWWKRKEWDWYRTNMWGGVIKIYPIFQPPCESFKSLEDAKKRIEEWRKEPIYHYT